MNVTRVTLTDFRSWSFVDLPIEAGVSLLSGSNGAGKSSLVEAVLVALYGAPSDAGAYIRRGTDEAIVSVHLETEQGELVVRRSIKRSGVSAKVSLQVWHDGENVSAATATETQAQLDQAIGVSRDVLLASAFSLQFGGYAFTEAAPRDRKRIFGSILNLGFWDTLADEARLEKRGADDAAAITRTELERLDGARHRLVEAQALLETATVKVEVARADETLAEEDAARLAAEAEAAREARREHAAAVEAVARATGDHERATGERRAADEALARAKAAAANAPSVEDAQALAHEADLQLAEAEARHADAEKDARHYLDQLAEARRDLAAHEAARDRHAAEAIELEERKSKAEGDACPECGKPLDQPEDHLVRQRAIARHAYALTNRDQEQEAIDSWRARESYLVGNAPDPGYIMQAGDAVKEARGVAETAQRKLAEAQTIQSLAGSIDTAQQRARAAFDRENDTAEQLREATAAVLRINSQNRPDDAPLDDQHQAALAALATARAAHSAAAAELARAEEAAKLAERQAAEETAARERLEAATREAAIEDMLAKGFGPTGCPAMIVDSVLGDLADEANRVLAELASPIRVDLRSQKLLKTSDQLADTLDIIVTMDAMEAPYETLSGGERTRVALALRAALTRLLASKRGARVRLLVVDEPAGLDASGGEHLAGVLNEFIAAGVFDTILLVTHHDALADLIGRVVGIEKSPGGESRLVSNSAGSTSGRLPEGGPAEQLRSAHAS